MPADSLTKIAREIQKCKKCRLWKSRIKAVPGEGPAPAGIMFIGQAPGERENQTGRPFIGPAGKFLDELLKQNGINRKKVFITSPVKCFPPGNRKPKPDELKACRPYLDRQLAFVKPKTIVLMGRVAFHTFFPEKDLKKEGGKWLMKNGFLFLPTYHPAAGMRFPKVRKVMGKDFKKLK